MLPGPTIAVMFVGGCALMGLSLVGLVMFVIAAARRQRQKDSPPFRHANGEPIGRLPAPRCARYLDDPANDPAESP